MTQEEIEYIKRNLKWPISIEYVSSLLFVFIPLLLIYSGLKQILDKKSYFTADRYSFIINNKKIYFNDIVTIGVTNIEKTLN